MTNLEGHEHPPSKNSNEKFYSQDIHEMRSTGGESLHGCYLSTP